MNFPVGRCFFLSVLGVLVFAHDFTHTPVELCIDATRFKATIQCDLDALALGESPEADNGALVARLQAMDPVQRVAAKSRLVAYFQRRIRIFLDDEKVPFQVHVPPSDPHAVPPSFFGIHVLLEGEIPPGTGRLRFAASRAFPPIVLKVLSTDGDPLVFALQRGDSSPEFELAALQRVSSPLWRYLVLGFRHILPDGWDHICFVLGLFFLCTNIRWLAWQVTAFTLAHSMTLSLALFQLINLPSKPVEILIALSIVYVAMENLLTREMRPHRIALVFLFGLLHGLGFAGSLAQWGLPEDQYVFALACFNLGVEFGQAAVLMIAFLVFGRLAAKGEFRKYVTLPGSCLILSAGLYWTIQRALT